MYVPQRKLLMQQSIEPVTDGLVVWIDGRDFFSYIRGASNNSTGFYNRANGGQITANLTYEEIFNTDNGFLSASSRYSNYGHLFYTPNYSIQTAEFCGSFIPPNDPANAGGLYLGLTGLGASPNGALLQITKDGFSGNGEAAIQTIPVSQNQVVLKTWANAGYSQKTYCNGEIVYTGRQNAKAFISKSEINSKVNWVWCGTFYIGSIRMYSKALTAEEAAQNYAYEKSIGRVN